MAGSLASFVPSVPGVVSNAVEVYIHGLRKKLGTHLIQNVRGVGYMVPRP